ncbi:MAG: response regulator [Alphaproteobacteria bacterium]
MAEVRSGSFHFGQSLFGCLTSIASRYNDAAPVEHFSLGHPMSKLTRIMIVEDDPMDSDLFVRFFRKRLPDVKIEKFYSADNALSRLNFETIDPEGDDLPPDPDIIVLDLGLSGMDGQVFIRKLRGNEHLRHIPIVVISGSGGNRDVRQDTYSNGANAVFQNPDTRDEYETMIGSIVDFWGKTVKMAS